jgi:hypothetical protein
MPRPKKSLRTILCGGCWNTGEEEYVPNGMPAQHYCYRLCSTCKGETKSYGQKRALKQL